MTDVSLYWSDYITSARNFRTVVRYSVAGDAKRNVPHRNE